MRIDFFSVTVQNLQRLWRKPQPAVSSARYERAGEITENEMLVLDSSPRSCWEAIRFAPSEASIFLSAQTDRKENTMDSHEIHTQNYELMRRGLAWFRRTHFTNHPEMTEEQVANQILLIVLAHPETLSAITSRLVRYRNAEGLHDDTALHNWLNARKEYRRKGVRA
jgi:hypothetical protein